MDKRKNDGKDWTMTWTTKAGATVRVHNGKVTVTK
jgi:hypothetical protein